MHTHPNTDLVDQDTQINSNHSLDDVHRILIELKQLIPNNIAP